MASISTSISPSLQNQNHFSLDSIRVLVLSINHHMIQFLKDSNSRKRLLSNCNSKFGIRKKQDFFEFSEQSVLSNLYWGIENVEAAIRTVSVDDRIARLKSAEQMLQVPALLEEYGSTVGISNQYLVCCAYFYLSLIRKLEGDEWEMTLHFLQAAFVSPRHVRMEFAPELWESLFHNQIISENEKMVGKGRMLSTEEDVIDESTRQMARRYKDCMMYYRVVLYGETPQWLHGCVAAYANESEPSDSRDKKATSSKHSDAVEQNEMIHPHVQGSTGKQNMKIIKEKPKAFLVKDTRLDKMYHPGMINERKDIKCLQDMLKEYESDTSASTYFHVDSTEGSDFEENMHPIDMSAKILRIGADVLASKTGERKLLSHGSDILPDHAKMSQLEVPGCPILEEADDLNTSYFFSSRTYRSDNDLSTSELRDTELASFCSSYAEDEAAHQRTLSGDFRCSSSGGMKIEFLNSKENPGDLSLHQENDAHMEILGRFEKAASTLYLSAGLKKCEDAGLEVSTVREMLNNKPGVKYGLLKEAIVAQLLNVISSSKEDIVRASVVILLVLISENNSIIEDIKRKNSYLHDLANALKRNIHEAAVLIYLLNPSATEIKELELLSAFVEVACSLSGFAWPVSLPLTPAAASIMMIEVLITKLDYATNNKHLEVISSPKILARLVNVARYKNLEECPSLVVILISCMRFDGNCRIYLAQVAPVATFLRLLKSNKRHAKFAALEFFNEILRMPRSSATRLLHQIRLVGNINVMHTLMACIQQLQPVHRLWAANLLLQLDMMEDSHGKSTFREEAMETLLESITSEECPSAQALSAFILSNLGGSYVWTGEPSRVAWLLKKTGIMSSHHKNMIRNFDWSDQSLQDAGTEPCHSKVARSIIKIGNPVFHALEKGLQSNTRSVSRDCLIAIAWLGCEIATMDPSCLGYSTRKNLLNGAVQFLHPWVELEERLLACLCVYNYASGKGMQNLMNVSEAVRDSLRCLSSITWMAEELLKVTDYFLPTKSHVSCVHTQMLEAHQTGSGATTALIYYKGQLFSGYYNGSIKVWDIKGQTSKLVLETKEHKKVVTCFALYEPDDSLLSASADKTIRVWKMVRRKLECVEIIEMKEPIQKIDTHGQTIFAITLSRGVKVCDASRHVRVICRSKHVKCIAADQGKMYLGCTDSSIQELDMMADQMREIKSPVKSWWMQKRPVNSIFLYKDWLYSASDIVEGSQLKDWRQQSSKATTKLKDVLALAVVEDFMYLNCSSFPSILQIWLRGKHQKVGRLSAGSRITSLLTANDIVLCGTEAGLIKGWIPF